MSLGQSMRRRVAEASVNESVLCGVFGHDEREETIVGDDDRLYTKRYCRRCGWEEKERELATC